MPLLTCKVNKIRNHLLFVGSARWIKRIITLKPTSTANTIDILIIIMMNGFVVTGCPINSPHFRLILAQPAAILRIRKTVQTHWLLSALTSSYVTSQLPIVQPRISFMLWTNS